MLLYKLNAFAGIGVKNLETLFYQKLKKILKPEQIKTKEPLSKYTTFRIGGAAEYFVTPNNAEEIRQIIFLSQEENIPYLILGNGSNLLISDQGYQGIVIRSSTKEEPLLIEKERKEEKFVVAKSDILLSKLAMYTANNGLMGLEFAAGIPGSLGGAIVMNAGAYGGEIKDFLVEVEILDEMGIKRTMKKDELNLGYRSSIFQNKRWFVLSAKFALKQGNKSKILERIHQLNTARKEKQPLQYPSAGSTFKRPKGNYAAKLIMEAGLAGFQIGGAKVSEKHCGFVINVGNAAAEDVVLLMHHIKEEVKKQFGIELEPEVKLVGLFKNQI